MKAHNISSGNELADQLAKEAACDGELDIAYNKHPKSAVISELKELGLQKWQSEWDSSNKEALTKKNCSPKVKDRLAKRLQMCLNLSTVITGHGKFRGYLHRFKIIDPMRPCEMNPQTTDHLIRECTLLRKQRQRLKKSIMKAGGNWPKSNTELANTYKNIFHKFVNSINLETL